VTDPVREKRARIAKLVGLGLAAGYGLFALAMVLFVVGLVVGYTDPLVQVIVLSLVIGSIVLAPAIVFTYAVRAADRDDAERGL
jgi:multisubunit Na+/H+ antiporter MnhC subunit